MHRSGGAAPPPLAIAAALATDAAAVPDRRALALCAGLTAPHPHAPSRLLLLTHPV
jgi:hypothetical protein